jgi:hypothetical protein
MLLGEIWAFINGSDLLLAHPGVSESLHYAVIYTLSNQQLLTWLLCLLVMAIPVWSKQPISLGAGYTCPKPNY